MADIISSKVTSGHHITEKLLSLALNNYSDKKQNLDCHWMRDLYMMYRCY